MISAKKSQPDQIKDCYDSAQGWAGKSESLLMSEVCVWGGRGPEGEPLEAMRGRNTGEHARHFGPCEQQRATLSSGAVCFREFRPGRPVRWWGRLRSSHCLLAVEVSIVPRRHAPAAVATIEKPSLWRLSADEQRSRTKGEKLERRGCGMSHSAADMVCQETRLWRTAQMM